MLYSKHKNIKRQVHEDTTRHYKTLTISIAAFVAVIGAKAAVVNGSFETGDYTGWETFYQTSLETAASGVSPTHGNYFAYLAAPDGGDGNASALETFLGVSDSALQGIKNGYTDFTSGSAIRTTFSASAGSVLTFDSRFLTDEDLPSSWDFAFYTLNYTPSSLGDTETSTFSVLGAYLVGGYQGTPWSSTSIILPNSGSYTLGFGVLQAGDNSVSSGLAVDNVSVVPEPSTIIAGALLLLPLAGSAIRKLRKA